jgi:hypothetical protein
MHRSTRTSSRYCKLPDRDVIITTEVVDLRSVDHGIVASEQGRKSCNSVSLARCPETAYSSVEVKDSEEIPSLDNA